MGIKIFGKFENRQDGGKLMDYVDIEGAPILEQDLSASGLTLVANSYYKHTGANGEYITGIVYYYDGEELKPIDGSGALGEVTELETEQVEPGEIEIDSEPIKDSPNVITSGGTYNALQPLKNSISAIQEEVGRIPRITVDETLNATSTNPISNKTVNAAVVQVNNKISEVENKITQTGDYVDTKSTQTITGTKIFNNIQADDILFKTEDGKGYNCHLTGNPTATPDSAAPLKIYLPKEAGTLALDSENLLTSSYERITTSENYTFDSKISIPLKSGFTLRKHTYEIEWTYDNVEASHQLTVIGDLMLDAGSLAHEDKYICHSAYHQGVRIDFFAFISIDEEDSSDNGKFELGVNIQGSPAGLKYIYVHSIRAKAR